MQVVKVLHGADSDVVWLQRDFGIYVANLFDTGQAARVLAFPSAGLAYALSRFCSVKVHVPLNRMDMLIIYVSEHPTGLRQLTRSTLGSSALFCAKRPVLH